MSPHCDRGALTSSKLVWPRSGMTRAGHAYEHQMLVPHTNGIDCFSWHRNKTEARLPTPCARDGKGRSNQLSSLPNLVGHFRSRQSRVSNRGAAATMPESNTEDTSRFAGTELRPPLKSQALLRLVPTPT